MTLAEINITKTDFESFDWQEVIRECEDKQCWIYYELYFKKSEEYDTDEENKSNVCKLMGHLCSMILESDSIDEPYKPQITLRDRRSAIIDDFSEDQIQVLSEIIHEIEDPELQARVCDILWIRNKDYQFALLAINAYLESYKVLLNHKLQIHYFQRIERAYNLSISLNNSEKLKEIIAEVEKHIDQSNQDNIGNPELRLMKLLIRVHKEIDIPKYIKMSEAYAKITESKNKFPIARAFWELNVKWNMINKDKDSAKVALKMAAETHYKQSTIQSSNLNAVLHIERAIVAYRRVGGQDERIEQLHKELLAKQAISVRELNSFSHEFDFTDLKENSIKSVKGKTFQDSIFTLVLSLNSPPVEKLRQQVEENVKNFPLQHISSSRVITKEGKVVSRRSNVMSDDTDEAERAIIDLMFKELLNYYYVSSISTIEPIRSQIMLEHHVCIEDFEYIVHNSPFVPEGRELLFSLGLYSGLKGKYVESTHILIPQIENSIRGILSQLRVITSQFDADGIQDEYNLNTMLYREELNKVLGDDIVFDLRGLLIEKSCVNLRNRMAHGLIHAHSFMSLESVYLWHMVLRLCCLPIIKEIHESRVE